MIQTDQCLKSNVGLIFWHASHALTVYNAMVTDIMCVFLNHATPSASCDNSNSKVLSMELGPFML